MPNRSYPVQRRKNARHGTKTPKVKIYRIVPLKTPYADNKFSLWIRARDGKCRRCGQDKPLDNSHYWRRDMKGTRFDPLNCVALCRDCHTYWEKQQNEEYKQFMIDWLGIEKYHALEKRARAFKKMSDAVLEFMEWYKTVDISFPARSGNDKI